MEGIYSDMDYFVNNFKDMLPLCNSHMVDFFTKNLFVNMLPMSIRDELMSLNFEEITDLVLNRCDGTRDEIPCLVAFLEKTNNLALKGNKYCLSVEEMFSHLGANGTNEISGPQITRLMSEKKSYEVEVMSGIVTSLAKGQSCSHLVDVGGGKGYLSSILALNHGIKVLSVDSSIITSKGAAKQIPKIEVRRCMLA